MAKNQALLRATRTNESLRGSIKDLQNFLAEKNQIIDELTKALADSAAQNQKVERELKTAYNRKEELEGDLERAETTNRILEGHLGIAQRERSEFEAKYEAAREFNNDAILAMVDKITQVDN